MDHRTKIKAKITEHPGKWRKYPELGLEKDLWFEAETINLKINNFNFTKKLCSSKYFFNEMKRQPQIVIKYLQWTYLAKDFYFGYIKNS